MADLSRVITTRPRFCQFTKSSSSTPMQCKIKGSPQAAHQAVRKSSRKFRDCHMLYIGTHRRVYTHKLQVAKILKATEFLVRRVRLGEISVDSLSIYTKKSQRYQDFQKKLNSANLIYSLCLPYTHNRPSQPIQFRERPAKDIRQQNRRARWLCYILWWDFITFCDKLPVH